MFRRRFSAAMVFATLTLVYFVAGKLGLRLAFLQVSASPVWPPAGIALGALLVLGYRTWPAILVGAFLVNISTTGNIPTSVAIGAGNTLEAICGAWLVNRFAGGMRVFDHSQNVFKFGFAAVTSTVISPTIGVTSLALAGFADWARYGAVWVTWWLGDATGDLIFAPVVILWAIAPPPRWSSKKALEVGLLLLLLVAARNRDRDFHRLGDRDLGHVAELRAICDGDPESIAADSAKFYGGADNHCDGAGSRHGRATRSGGNFGEPKIVSGISEPDQGQVSRHAFA